MSIAIFTAGTGNMVTNQPTEKLNIGSKAALSSFQRSRGVFTDAMSRAAKAFINISFENLFLIVIISMLFMATTFTAFIMGKDAERNISVKAATSIASTLAPASTFCDTGLKATLELLKLDRAPTVVGLKENDAVNKLKKAKVEDEKITVSHEKMTYPALVERSSTLFFGEVESQKVSTKGISLNIIEADLDDPFTAQMNTMGSRLAWPVPGNERISSHFGGRSSPGGIGTTNHQGIDIPAPTGKPIIAVKSGKVEQAGRMGGYGNCVVVDHENGFKSLYGHMSQITCNAGDEVEPGDVIGKVGSTGWSTGPHLHFGLLNDGTYIDPEPFFTGKENVNAGSEVSTNDTGAEDPNNNNTDSSKSSTKATDPDKDEKKTEDKSNGSSGSNKNKNSNSSGDSKPASGSSGGSNTSGGDTGSGSGGSGGDSGGSSGSDTGSGSSGGSSSGGDTGGGTSGGGDSGSGSGGTSGGGDSGGSGGDSGGSSGGSGGDSGGSSGGGQ